MAVDKKNPHYPVHPLRLCNWSDLWFHRCRRWNDDASYPYLHTWLRTENRSWNKCLYHDLYRIYRCCQSLLSGRYARHYRSGSLCCKHFGICPPCCRICEQSICQNTEPCTWLCAYRSWRSYPGGKILPVAARLHLH